MQQNSPPKKIAGQDIKIFRECACYDDYIIQVKEVPWQRKRRRPLRKKRSSQTARERPLVKVEQKPARNRPGFFYFPPAALSKSLDISLMKAGRSPGFRQIGRAH